MIPHDPLQPLRDLDRTSPQFHEQLVDFLHGDQYQIDFPILQGDDLTWLVEYLDRVLLDISDPASLAFQVSLHELGRVCSIKEVLPKSCTLPGPRENIGLTASGCVCAGTLDGSRVHVERVRTRTMGDSRGVREVFHHVAAVWRHLRHPNIVPLLGVILDPLQLVSIPMSGGNLTEYTVSNPAVDRLSLLSDVAEGLNYLHNCNIIHGDLKGSNVLVDAADRARVTDFGLAVVTQDLDSIRNAPDDHGHSARWIAPEILRGRGTYSKEADVFSFAMVTIEVFTGAIPFGDEPPHAAMRAIVGGVRPPRPTDPTLTDRLWGLTQRCWDQDDRRRPRALRISCSFGVPAWKRLAHHPLSPSDRVPLIIDLFFDRDEVEALKHISTDDAQSFIDVLDETLDRLGPRHRGRCLTTLCKICGHHALLPRSVQISLLYNRTDTPRYQGGFAEVWKAEHEGREVAIKVLKVYVSTNPIKIRRMFCKEVMTWKALRHQNVLPLLGVTMSGNHLTMVSEWMVNGNINEFIKAHRDANRFELLKDIARGLIYMHCQAMIHGDLKGANILIDNDGHARLADFGLITIVSDSTNITTSSSTNSGGTTRWMSPELFYPEKFGLKDNRRTKESDCYALGMVVLEVLTSQVPFPQCDGFIITRKVVDGERPERPQGPEAVWFTNDLWEMLGQCWSHRPKIRPAVESVLECLERNSMAWRPLSPSVDDNFQVDSDGSSFSALTRSPLSQTIPLDDSQSSILSQSPSHKANTGQSPSQSSPVSQQQPGEPLALLEPVDIGQGLSHLYNLDYNSKNEIGASIDHTPVRPPNLQSTYDTMPSPHISRETLPPYNNDSVVGRNTCETSLEISDIASSVPELQQQEPSEPESPPQDLPTAQPRRYPTPAGPVMSDASQLYEPLLPEGERGALNDLIQFLELGSYMNADFRSADSLTALTALLCSDDADRQRAAALVFAKITEKEIRPVSRETIDSILFLLNGPDIEVQCTASAALCNLAMDVDNGLLIAELGGLEILIHMMSSPNVNARLNAVGCLMNLAAHDALRSWITESWTLRSVVHLARSKNTGVQRSAIGALLNLSQSEENRRQLGSAGALPVLVRHLNSSDADVRDHCITALGNIAAGGESITFHPSSQGRVHPVSGVNGDGLARSRQKVIRSFIWLMKSSHLETRHQAALGLQNLSRDAECRLTIVNAGGLTPILHLFRSKHPPLVLSAAACAHNMSIDPTNASPIIAAGFLEPLIQHLSFKDGLVSHHAISTLRNLAASSEENKWAIVEADAVQAIRELALNAPSDVQSEMMACVAILALSDKLKGKLLGTGICEILIRLAFSPYSEVKSNSGVALGNLSSRDSRTGYDDYSAFNRVWDGPGSGMHGFLFHFLTNADPLFQHVAVWTIVQFLESGDPKLISNIHSSPLLVPHIEQLATSHVRSPSSPSRDPDDARLSLVKETSVAAYRRDIQVLSRRILDSIAGVPTGDLLRML